MTAEFSVTAFKHHVVTLATEESLQIWDVIQDLERTFGLSKAQTCATFKELGSWIIAHRYLTIERSMVFSQGIEEIDKAMFFALADCCTRQFADGPPYYYLSMSAINGEILQVCREEIG